jgi:membrane fusion protein (multidrug efflux system)
MTGAMGQTETATRIGGAGIGREDSQRRSRTAKTWIRRVLLAAGAVTALAAILEYGAYYWRTGRLLVETDDAYVQADSVIISPKVSGYIAEVLVRDNQPVTAGQVLAHIDDRDYRTALAQARASVDAAQAGIANLDQEIAQQRLSVEQARQTVTADRAAVTFAQQDTRRYSSLARTGAATLQEAQHATADIQEQQALLQKDITGVDVAQKQVDVLQSQLAKAGATLLLQQALEHQAELNLSYTTITAPIDGSIGVRTLRVGQYVQAGTQLMAVVPLAAVYVVANYKETQLTDVRAGQPATIDIDTFPGKTVHGHVDSLAPASGQEFALLPPDNATGNFTKIVQRIPVKIDIDPADPLAGLLRPGMSVEPTIDTRAGRTG